MSPTRSRDAAAASEIAPPVVSLADLPLRDHLSGQSGGVAEAARDWRAQRAAAVTRDEAAERAEELAAAREEGYREGLSDGRVAAEADGLELLRTLSTQVAAASQSADAAVDRVIAATASDLVEAAMEIARWAIGREVSVAPEALLDVAAQALRDAGGVAGSQVLVPPDMGRAASAWAHRFGVQRPEVVEDAALRPGTVVVRSASGGTAELSVATLVARACEALGLGDAVEDEEQG